MALVNTYCDKDELRAHLGDDGSRLDDALLERAINSASRAVDRHCKRRFWQDSDVATRTFEVDHPLEAYVDDISTRTGLVVSIGSDGLTYPTTLTVDTDFVLEPRNADAYASSTFDAYAFWKIRLVAGRSFTVACRPTLSVTARFGWSAVPTEVTEATLIKATSLFKRKDAPLGVAGFGEFGVVRIGRSDPDVMELLASYVVPVV